MRRCFQNAKPGQHHKGQHIKRSRPRPENTVIRGNQRNGGGSKNRRAHPLQSGRIGQTRLERKKQCHRHQNNRHDHAQPIHRHGMRQRRTTRPRDGTDRRHSQLIPQPHLPRAGIADRRSPRAKSALQFIRRQSLQWRRPGQQQRRHRDQPTTPRNGINKSGSKTSTDQKDGQIVSNFEHQNPG